MAKPSPSETGPHDPDLLQIGEDSIRRGTRITIDLPVGKLYTHAPVTMPVHVVRGRRSGPCLFLSAAIHGDEVNGVEIIRRVLGLKAIQRLRGTLLAIPVVNVHGLVHRSRYLPDRRDLNRSFPGLAEGSMAGRLAHLFLNEIVEPAHFGIDLHTGSNFRTNFPQVRAQLDDADTERLARVFGAPVILDAALRDGSLREAAEKSGTVVVVYEGGETLRFDELAIKTGVRGILNVMRDIGMLPPGKTMKLVAKSSLCRRSTWARSPQSGIFRALVKPGSHVTRNQVLGRVADPFGENDAPVVATEDGIVVGMSTTPLANLGEALFHIAQFESPGKVAQRIETLREDFDAEPDA